MKKDHAPILFAILILGAYAVYQSFAYGNAEKDYPAKLLDSVVIATLSHPESYRRESATITRDGGERIRVTLRFTARNDAGGLENGEASLSLMDPALHSLTYAELSAEGRDVLEKLRNRQVKQGALDPRNAFVETVEINGRPLPKEAMAKLHALGQRGRYPFYGPELEPLRPPSPSQ